MLNLKVPDHIFSDFSPPHHAIFLPSLLLHLSNQLRPFVMALGSVENGQVQADGEGLLVHHLHLQDMDGLSGHFDLCQEPQQCRGNCKELGEGFQQPTSITIVRLVKQKHQIRKY